MAHGASRGSWGSGPLYLDQNGSEEEGRCRAVMVVKVEVALLGPIT